MIFLQFLKFENELHAQYIATFLQNLAVIGVGLGVFQGDLYPFVVGMASFVVGFGVIARIRK